MTRKEFIENILGTKLTTQEFSRLKKEQFRFYQSPGKYVAGDTRYIGKKKNMITIQDIKDWLASIR